MEQTSKIGFVIQARMGSERLPNKILKPFYEGKSVLEMLIQRIRAEFKSMPIIIATSSEPKDEILLEVAKQMSVQCIKGSEENVLSRFVYACSTFQLDFAFRVCSDNPFLDVKSFRKLESVIRKNPSLSRDVDYVSYKLNNKPVIKTHLGLWGELVSLKALEKVSELTNKKVYLEHVTNYIYEHPQMFNLKWLQVPKIASGHNDIRLTLDTAEDYDILTTLFKELQKNRIPLESEAVINYLLDKKQLRHKMKEQILMNKK